MRTVSLLQENGENMKNKKALIGMSGGVDSAVAAFLLQNEYDVSGVTMRLWENGGILPDSLDAPPDRASLEARAVADILGIPHITVSFCESFYQSVVKDFICTYRDGKTPNPCVTCNRTIKFGRMFDCAMQLGFDFLATGHYASIVATPSGEHELRCAKDRAKDQTYFLWSIDRSRLQKILFPLGEYTKDEIRQIARENGFSNADKADSQDICFISDADYASFLEKYDSPVFKSGSFVDTQGNILGAHAGLERYTIGQRKGLGIALGVPMFVGAKDAASGNVTLCSDAELYTKQLTASKINLLVNTTLEHPERLEAKIRYRHTASPAVVTRTSEDSFSLVFDTAQRAVCSGQSVVLYDGDTVVGGGIIV